MKSASRSTNPRFLEQPAGNLKSLSLSCKKDMPIALVTESPALLFIVVNKFNLIKDTFLLFIETWQTSPNIPKKHGTQYTPEKITL